MIAWIDKCITHIRNASDLQIFVFLLVMFIFMAWLGVGK